MDQAHPVEIAGNARNKCEICRYFTGKTVAAPDDDPVYGATRKFYEAMGFVPLETFPTFWHARNPCLFMIKSLG